MAKKQDKRREKARQRKAARRKQKRASSVARTAPRGTSRSSLRAAGSWALYEGWLSAAWQDPGELVQILVARRSPAGDFAIGAFLVDLGCLGVKSAFARIVGQAEYRDLRASFREQQEMIETEDLDLLAKIVREGIAYAEQLGFRSDPDYRDALLVLGNADPDASEVPIPLGKDGKPLFVAGPHDNVDAIMNKLARQLGPGNFEYLVPVMGDDEFWFDDDDIEVEQD